MTYNRWLIVDRIVRDPRFTNSKCEERGLSIDELEIYLRDEQGHRITKNKRDNMKVVCFFGAIFISLLTWWISVVLTVNIFTTNSLENLTGKNLNYWDVLWGSSSIRANAALQNAR